MWLIIASISAGASLGALLRYVLGVWLNANTPLLPLGTLTANLLGGFVVGIAVAAVQHSALVDPWRQFWIAGFCGGLTTFSTFSVEIFLLLEQGRLGWALAAVSAHLFGSLLMTCMGFATWRFFHPT